MRIEGACHCRNVTFTVDWPGDPQRLPARACGCGFCTRHGGVWTSNPAAVLDATVHDPSLLSVYRFGTATADFHVCARCGVPTFVTSEIDGNRYAVVNVNAFEGVDRARLQIAGADFEGEELGDRLARRTRNWIADVRIDLAGASAG